MGQLLAIGILTAAVILLVMRPIVWWYFGIGRAIAALESIDASLRCLPAVKSDASRRAA
jgi:hypothetical protein